MSVVRLRNGAEEAELLVVATMLHLERLYVAEPLAFFDAIMVARDPSYRTFGDVGATLRRLALLDQAGRMHGSIRNVLLSAAEGDGMDMRLVDPIGRRA